MTVLSTFESRENDSNEQKFSSKVKVSNRSYPKAIFLNLNEKNRLRKSEYIYHVLNTSI